MSGNNEAIAQHPDCFIFSDEGSEWQVPLSHKCEMPAASSNVCSQRLTSERHLLRRSSSDLGTFETCRPVVRMSASSGRPEVMGRPSK